MTGLSLERIKLLPDSVKKKIAAGEVVEGPFSVVKEIVENSIDAGASRIDVQVSDGGLKKIFVRDDGRGMYRDDISLAVMEHATSKIQDIHDIERISSYGFRGEALSSISSVSRLTILSRRADEETGGRLTGADGSIEVSDFAGPTGTTVIVENLFYNVPARKKFLKSVRTELRLIREVLLKIAIPHPEIAFTLDVDDSRQITLNQTEKIEQRIGQIYGGSIMNDLYREMLQDLKVAVSGFLSRPHFLKSSRTMQILYVNGRPVEYRYLGFLLSKAYEAVAGKGKYPAGIIFIDIDPHLVDVNIHPAKKEVKLFDSYYINRLILALAEKAINREHRVESRLFTPGEARVTEGTAHHTDSGDSFRDARKLFDSPGRHMRTSAGIHVPDDISSSTFVKDMAELYHDIEESKEIKIIGMAFETYIILEKSNCMYFIDFHAAHERIIFDSLMEKGSAFESQRLAFPRVLELSLEDHRLVRENIDKFSEIGFDIEDFSDNSIKITAVPEVAGRADSVDLIMDFLESIRGEYETSNVAEKMAATVACHAAKRAGDRLAQGDMEKLVSEIFSTDRQLRCPHGRPFVFKMEKEDIERMFKRQ
jgi:DNA mismatch repair protein MutL